MPSFDLDISVNEFYDELYDSEKKELAELLKMDGFLDNEEIEDLNKFQKLNKNYFRFTREDEEILNKLFEKYILC